MDLKNKIWIDEEKLVSELATWDFRGSVLLDRTFGNVHILHSLLLISSNLIAKKPI